MDRIRHATASSVLSIFALLALWGQAGALERYIHLDNPEKAIPFSVPYGEDRASGKLKLVNGSGKDITVSISVGELKHGEKKKAARFSLTCAEGKAIQSLACRVTVAKGQTAEIPFDVEGLEWKGDYTARATLEGLAGKPVIDFVVTKEERPKDLQLENAKEGSLPLSRDRSERKKFRLTLKNPEDGVFRRMALKDVSFENGKASFKGLVTEKEITFEPGQARTLHMTLENPPVMGGTFEGCLTLSDKERGAVTQAFKVVLSSSYTRVLGREIPNSWVNIVVAVLLVMLGWLASFLLSRIPISTIKADNNQKIEEWKELIRSLTEFEPRLQQKLLIELLKLKTINGNTRLFTLSATDRMKTVQAAIEGMNSRLAEVTLVKEIYVNAAARKDLSFSLEEEVRECLDDAYRAIYGGSLKEAEKKAKEAQEKLKKLDAEDKDALRKVLIETLKTLGADRIGKLLKETDVQALPPARQRPVYIDDLVTQLKEETGDLGGLLDGSAARLKELGSEALLRKVNSLDLLYNKVRIYFELFEKGMHEKYRQEDNRAQYDRIEERLLGFLRKGSRHALRCAIAYCRSLETGVTEEDIDKALEGRRFNIRSEPAIPNIDKPVDFSLVFEDENLNGTPLTGNHYFYRILWDFGDRTTQAKGIAVSHYFKRRGLFILQRKWLRRNVLSFFGSPLWRTFDVTVRVHKAGGNIPLLPGHLPGGEGDFGRPEGLLRDQVPVAEPIEKAFAAGITFIDVFGVAVSVIVSSVIAVLNTYGETVSFSTLKDVLTPFLLGFALDVSRDKLTNPQKVEATLKELKGKGKQP